MEATMKPTAREVFAQQHPDHAWPPCGPLRRQADVKVRHDRDGVAIGYLIDCGCGEKLFVETEELPADAKKALGQTPDHSTK